MRRGGRAAAFDGILIDQNPARLPFELPSSAHAMLMECVGLPPSPPPCEQSSPACGSQRKRMRADAIRSTPHGHLADPHRRKGTRRAARASTPCCPLWRLGEGDRATSISSSRSGASRCVLAGCASAAFSGLSLWRVLSQAAHCGAGASPHRTRRYSSTLSSRFRS